MVGAPGLASWREAVPPPGSARVAARQTGPGWVPNPREELVSWRYARGWGPALSVGRAPGLASWRGSVAGAPGRGRGARIRQLAGFMGWGPEGHGAPGSGIMWAVEDDEGGAGDAPGTWPCCRGKGFGWTGVGWTGIEGERENCIILEYIALSGILPSRRRPKAPVSRLKTPKIYFHMDWNIYTRVHPCTPTIIYIYIHLHIYPHRPSGAPPVRPRR